MKRFRFALQPIRVLREQKERVTQERFAEATRLCEEAAYQFQEASEALAKGWAALCDELSAGVAATKLMRSRAWCSVLEHRQKERSDELNETRRAMDAAWKEMMAATRDREALDRYHDKSRRLHDRESQKEERKALDEIGVRRTANAGLSGGPNRKRTD
jgi:flagellar export protein FliJ